MVGDPHSSRRSIDDTLVIVSPALLDALRRIGPKRRPARVPAVVGLSLVALVLALAMDRSTREFVTARLRLELDALPASEAGTTDVVSIDTRLPTVTEITAGAVMLARCREETTTAITAAPNTLPSKKTSKRTQRAPTAHDRTL